VLEQNLPLVASVPNPKVAEQMAQTLPRTPMPKDIAAARMLPDEMFSADLRVQRSVQEIEKERERLTAKVRTTMERERERLTAEIALQEKTMAGAAILDAAAGDAGFTRARKAIGSLDSDRTLLQTINAALTLIQQVPEAIPDSQLIAEMRDHQEVLLSRLKLEHVRSQKES
jgi:hypothetical protein